jgi:hypothetical protein
MLSGKTWIILAAILVVIVVLAALALDPVLAAGPATGLSWFSANWDCYMISVGFPIAIYYAVVWNPEAGRAVNPFSGRFVSHARVAGFAVVLAVIGFVVVTFIAIPILFVDFLAYSAGPGYTPVTSLFLQLGLIVGLPVLCVAIASPAGLARTFGSIRRNW